MPMPVESKAIKQNNLIHEYYNRREVWENKPHIRLVYKRWVDMMRPFLPKQGPLLEVGSGSGLLRDFMPGIILSDVVTLPWIDCLVDCLHMPFGDESLTGIIDFDVLHHLAQPHSFLDEVTRVLKPGGRAFFIEPYITFLSFFGYKFLHHEHIYFKDYSLDKGKKDPWLGNLAVANLVFGSGLKKWELLHPNLKIIHRELFGLFDFTCAAGFKPYAFVPYRLFQHIVKAENYLTWLMPLAAFRIFIVIEKT
ncbi:MAG: methyltransferase domain-containing protein [Candidatus Omnitrophota bacterium]|jgi:SAM-dependent methyltransferase